MAVVGQAILELQGDHSGLTRSFRAAQSEMGRFGGTLSDIGSRWKRQFTTIEDSALSLRGALGLLAGATGAVLAATKIFQLGAAVEETASKFRTVLGPEVVQSQKFLDEFANTAGLTRREGQDLLATVAAIGQGMGMSTQQSAGFAQEIVKLAGDLSSFNNIPIAETSRAIIGGITGERESLKRLGIVILETDVQKRALLQTGKEHVEQLTQEEKAAASLALIMERAGVAVGDLERTKTSAANRARALTAQFKDMRDALAAGLQPVFLVILEELAKIGGAEGFQGVSKAMQENGDRIAAWTRFAIESIKTVGIALGAVVRVAFNVGQMIGRAFEIAASIMVGNMLKAGELIRVDWADLANIAQKVFDPLGIIPDFKFESGSIRSSAFFENAAKQARNLAGDIGDVQDTLGAVADGFTRMLDASQRAWETAKNGAQETAAAITSVGTAVANAQATAGAAGGAGGMGGAVSIPGIPGREPDFLGAAAANTGALDALKLKANEVQAAFGGIEAEGVRALSGLEIELITVAQLGFEAFADFATGSKNAIRDFVQDAIRQLARLAARMVFFKLLDVVLPGVGTLANAGVSSQAALPRAHGGPVTSNHPYIVGERGPELFVPRNSGMVVPNHALAGGGTNITLDASRMPPPRHYMDAARDNEWLTWLAESLNNIGERGWRPR